MDIGLTFPNSLESMHGLFMIIYENIKYDFKNFGISQLFSKSIIIIEKRGVIVLANYLKNRNRKKIRKIR